MSIGLALFIAYRGTNAISQVRGGAIIWSVFSNAAPHCQKFSLQFRAGITTRDVLPHLRAQRRI
jgi:hypothetical protein